MGFTATFTHILSFLGIAVLGVGILLALAAIVPALSWLRAAASGATGPVTMRRIALAAVVLHVTLLHLASLASYDPQAWLRSVTGAGFLIGCLVPVLGAGSGGATRRRHRGLVALAALWWALLVFSEALLVSGAPRLGVLLYLFAVIGGAFSGACLGTLVAYLARPQAPVEERN